MLRYSVVMMAFILIPGLRAAEPEKHELDLRSDFLVGPLSLPECDKPVHSLRLTGAVTRNGEGSGTLELDTNAPKYDEFGFMTIDNPVPPLKLECTYKVVSTRKMIMRQSARVAAPEVEVEWVRIQIQGPKITSKMFLAHEVKTDGYARLMISGKDGKVQYLAHLHSPPPPEPCHPGCFPAGTPIRTPDGERPVESIKKGDAVTMVNDDGKMTSVKVASIFVTRNRLLKVETDAGNLVTTATQPLALADGGLRAAGEFKPGDRVWRFDGKERRAATVRSVTSTGREEPVYNLVLGNREVFIAGGFLARSKPPAPAADQP
jgi:hypothetical protein